MSNKKRLINIKLHTGEIIEGVEIFHNRNQIKRDSRMYYELGFKRNGGKWIRRGVFKEIFNPYKLKSEIDMWDDKEYIQHHNFVIKNK